MGAYFHVIDRRDSESIERFRRELGRLRETEHLHSDRRERVRRIARDIGFGHPVRQRLVDTGHAAGLEVHVLTSTGIVLVFNAGSGKLVTVLIARPGQVRRYYEPFGEAVPRDGAGLPQRLRQPLELLGGGLAARYILEDDAGWKQEVES